MSKDHFSASDLVALGYVPDRLTSVFGEPDSVDGEPRWDAGTVETVERDVLPPAVRVLWDAFAPRDDEGSLTALGEFIEIGCAAVIS